MNRGRKPSCLKFFKHLNGVWRNVSPKIPPLHPHPFFHFCFVLPPGCFARKLESRRSGVRKKNHDSLQKRKLRKSRRYKNGCIGSLSCRRQLQSYDHQLASPNRHSTSSWLLGAEWMDPSSCPMAAATTESCSISRHTGSRLATGVSLRWPITLLDISTLPSFLY